MEFLKEQARYLPYLIDIMLAVLLGFGIGLERKMRSKEAGIRTHTIVCFGSALMMVISKYGFGGEGDASRVAAQIVSGVGFLGAGTIVVTRRNQIKGLTTAAGLWTAAGVGLALGIGFYEAALIGGLAMFFVITVLQRMDNNMHRKSRQMEVYIELAHNVALGDFLRDVREKELEIYNVQREYEPDSDAGNRAYIATVKSKKRKNHLEVLEQVQSVPGVAYLEEL